MQFLQLPRDENQVRGIAQYAIDFCQAKYPAPDDSVLLRTEQFHTDSVACAIAAFGCNANAPQVLRNEALQYPLENGAFCFGSDVAVHPEKAVLANASAVRELDSNGTNFGYNPRTGYARGEFGHNDFYPVPIAAAQQANLNGMAALLGMICLDEIRGRLAEVFGLKDHKVDHVVHGAIASAAVYGAMLGATVDQIESAIGLVMAHYIPFRAIRHGHQLSDSKGASAAISSEVAVLSMRRAMSGFVGPADVFRNPQAIFRLFEPTEEDAAPFDLELATHGDDFAVMGMHFKLGLYEHQSAGAIQGLISVLQENPALMTDRDAIQSIRITIYEPAFGIIGDPAKRNPKTRQSADHSMVYIIGTMLRKALETKTIGWKELMLVPDDYSEDALHHSVTRSLMGQIQFVHGGAEYDSRYPDGIPTTLEIEHAGAGHVSSGLIMYPAGHARNTDAPLEELLSFKFAALTGGVGDQDYGELLDRLAKLRGLAASDIRLLYQI